MNQIFDNFKLLRASVTRPLQLDLKRPVWIFGAGNFGQSLCQAMTFNGVEVAGFVETNQKVNKILNKGTLQISGISGQPTLFKLERWPRICAEVVISNCDLVSFEGFAIELEGGGKVEVNACENLKSLKGLPSSLKQFSFGYGSFKNFEDFGDIKPNRIVSLPGTSKMAVDALKASNNDVKAAEQALKTQTGIDISILVKK